MELSGQNIILRSITAEDTEDILNWRNAWNVKKYFIRQEDITREEHRNWLQTQVDTGKAVQFVILWKENRKAAGSVYLKDIDHAHQKAEYGIFIGEEEMRQKGIGVMAAKQMADYAFHELGLHKLYLRVYEDNYPAIASYAKAGFQKAGLLRDDVCIRGKFKNIVLMEMIRQE